MWQHAPELVQTRVDLDRVARMVFGEMYDINLSWFSRKLNVDEPEAKERQARIDQFKSEHRAALEQLVAVLGGSREPTWGELLNVRHQCEPSEAMDDIVTEIVIQVGDRFVELLNRDSPIRSEILDEVRLAEKNKKKHEPDPTAIAKYAEQGIDLKKVAQFFEQADQDLDVNDMLSDHVCGSLELQWGLKLKREPCMWSFVVIRIWRAQPDGTKKEDMYPYLVRTADVEVFCTTQKSYGFEIADTEGFSLPSESVRILEKALDVETGVSSSTAAVVLRRAIAKAYWAGSALDTEVPSDVADLIRVCDKTPMKLSDMEAKTLMTLVEFEKACASHSQLLHALQCAVRCGRTAAVKLNKE